MEALLILPLVIIFALCVGVIWWGFRKPPPKPVPEQGGGEEAGLSPGDGGTPR